MEAAKEQKTCTERSEYNNEGQNYIRFDWAIKRLLRNKADFGAVNGLLSCLFEKQIFITTVLESEGNQEDENDKFNRVDVLVEDENGEKIIIEIQNNYLKTTKIPDNFTAQGLDEIRTKQKIEDLPKEERKAYYRHLDQVSYEEGVIEHQRLEAERKGIAEGLEKGEKLKTIEIAKKLKSRGMSFDQISEIAGLTIEEIEKI